MSDTADTLTQVDTPSRNTRGRAWCFTFNNYSNQELQDLKDYFEIDTETQFVLGKEIGENGTPHIQGCVRFKSARTFQSMKKLMPKCHIEICKNWNASVQYCKKEGNHSTKLANEKLICPDPLEGKELYPYQKDIKNRIKEKADDRTILWYWEDTGNIGKTTLTKHFVISCGAIMLSGKANDCKYTVSMWIDSQKKFPEVIIFHYVRSNEEYISYEAIEAIKDGMFMNTKYECKMVVYPCPHVIILANFEPKLEKLSADRWKVIEIDSSSGALVESSAASSDRP